MKTFKGRIRHTLSRPVTFVAIILTVSGLYTARKVHQYSADPSGEKDCPPLFPNSVRDPSKPSIIQIDAARNGLPWAQRGGAINDASCLNKTSIHGVVQVTEPEKIKEALLFAKRNHLKVSIAGIRHSMGGQAFYRNALVLDMTKFNKMSLDEEAKILTVQSGATWHEVQKFLHPKFAVKAMQSTDIFTVGGSIAVNAHGMDHNVGAMARTVRSMRIMLADGSIHEVSRRKNQELFDLVVGGYGLFGIILDAEIEVTDNVIYERERRIIDYKEFPDIFKKEIESNDKYGLFYGHLSTAPLSFLREMIIYGYKKVDIVDAEIPPLREVENVKLRRLMLNLAKLGQIGIKWFAEKYIEPRLETCSVSRNQALKEGETCLVSRNEPMHDSVKYLKNNLANDTDILHEYFIPRGQFIPFVDGVRQILRENKANVLNTSVRVVHREDNYLNYSPNDAFSIVLYLNQTTDEEANARMRKVTQELIDLTIAHGGRFFLPYQLHYTREQLERAYPEIGVFFAAKKKYDPDLVLTNTLYEKYSGGV